MIAFNFNIHFQDEPSLNDLDINPSLSSFHISSSSDTTYRERFNVISDHAELSGRKIKYYAQNSYEKCDIGCEWGVEIEDLLFISWRCGEHTLHYTSLNEYTPELLNFWVLHTIIPMALVLEKSIEVLHVGAVEIENEAVLLSALSYGGKSTLTDYFIEQGYHFFGDDTVGIQVENNIYKAVPSYPYCRPYRKPESLGLKSGFFVENTRKIKAIFVLNKVSSDAKIEIKQLNGIEKYQALHHSFFLNFDFLKQDHFHWMNEMINVIPVYNITIPWELNRLEEVYKHLIDFLAYPVKQ